MQQLQKFSAGCNCRKCKVTTCNVSTNFSAGIQIHNYAICETFPCRTFSIHGMYVSLVCLTFQWCIGALHYSTLFASWSVIIRPRHYDDHLAFQSAEYIILLYSYFWSAVLFTIFINSKEGFCNGYLVLVVRSR